MQGTFFLIAGNVAPSSLRPQKKNRLRWPWRQNILGKRNQELKKYLDSFEVVYLEAHEIADFPRELYLEINMLKLLLGPDSILLKSFKI